jgi:beta-glucanase (GH16 family)
MHFHLIRRWTFVTSAALLGSLAIVVVVVADGGAAQAGASTRSSRPSASAMSIERVFLKSAPAGVSLRTSPSAKRSGPNSSGANNSDANSPSGGARRSATPSAAEASSHKTPTATGSGISTTAAAKISPATVSTTTPSSAPTGPTTSVSPRSTVTFDDEFNGAAGTQPSQWTFQTGGNGWGNNELEQYTSRTDNSRLDGAGDLDITARKETYTGADKITRSYTSARLVTKTPISFGYLEARIKLPAGQGLWPALWTVGANITSVNWPYCGEIDALESVNDMSTAFGTIHGADTVAQAMYKEGGYDSPAGGLANTWHTYAIYKAATSITWYLDGHPYYAVNKSKLTAGQSWAFNQAQYVILNLAVGGNWPGSPNSTTPAVSNMLIDWIRAGTGVPPDAT